MHNPCKDYQMTRRALLAGGAASIMGLSVRDLMAFAGTSHKPTAEQVILFWNGGGMSHIDTWDPKPGRPTQGEFDAIDTAAPGVKISQIFPKLAKQMKNVSLIRSIAGTQGAHGRATYNLQTSYNQTPNIRHPGIGSVVTHELKRQGDLPSFVAISGRAARASYLGQRCEAYFVASPGDNDPYLAFPEGILKTRGNRRLDILARFNKRYANRLPDPRLKATQTSIDDAVKLMRSPALAAFDLEKASARDRARYGDTAFGRGALLARRLVETGVRFVQVSRGGFDTHSNNFPAMENHGTAMDPGLASLIEDLKKTGRLDKTLVIMLSEFGRTPKINANAGRDHWATCFSCLMAGGGIHGGKVIGSSDKDGYAPKDRPVEVADLHATVCHALGIKHVKEVSTPLGRPMKLVDGGSPVRELFS